jgi:hypothetical protein
VVSKQLAPDSRQELEIRGQTTEASNSTFKVPSSKFKVENKNEGLLPLTAHCLPLTNAVDRLPFTI